MLAQKTYDDVPLSPRSFVELWRCISSRQTEFKPANQEIVFLGLIDWNTHVKNHMYWKFYYAVRRAAEADPFPHGFTRWSPALSSLQESAEWGDGERRAPSCEEQEWQSWGEHFNLAVASQGLFEFFSGWKSQ